MFYSVVWIKRDNINYPEGNVGGAELSCVMSAVAAENESSLSLPVPRPDTPPPPPPAINTPLTSEVWSIRILTIILLELELSWTHWIDCI